VPALLLDEGAAVVLEHHRRTLGELFEQELQQKVKT
jgi:hypothetical protein